MLVLHKDAAMLGWYIPVYNGRIRDRDQRVHHAASKRDITTFKKAVWALNEHVYRWNGNMV